MGTIAQLFESGEQKANKGHFMNLVMLARVDGRVDITELALLDRIARKLSLTEEQIKEIIKNAEDYQMIPPFSEADRLERFIQLVQMAMVDGVVDSSEEGLVHKYGVSLGFEEEDVDAHFPAIVGMIQNGKSVDEIVAALS